MIGKGQKDGSKYGWKRGGRGRNKISICRNPELKKEREFKDIGDEDITTTPKRIIDKILSK